MRQGLMRSDYLVYLAFERYMLTIQTERISESVHNLITRQEHGFNHVQGASFYLPSEDSVYVLRQSFALLRMR